MLSHRTFLGSLVCDAVLMTADSIMEQLFCLTYVFLATPHVIKRTPKIKWYWYIHLVVCMQTWHSVNLCAVDLANWEVQLACYRYTVVSKIVYLLSSDWEGSKWHSGLKVWSSSKINIVK